MVWFLSRKWTLLSLLLLVPAGLATKQYHGPIRFWVNNSLGGVFYVIFWSLLLSLVAPRLRVLQNVVIVFAATCAVELLQLWHPPVLENFRHTIPGALLLGTTFTWSDFPHYATGALLALVFLPVLSRLERNVGS